MPINDGLHQELVTLKRSLLESGDLLTSDALKGYYQTFKQRFGPDRLEALTGRELLETMHDHGTRDSLVYWLEFKDDEELPAKFGSIAGGSALKFRLYRRRETGRWMTGSPQAQSEITEGEAISMAESHRDQLLKGDALLRALPQSATDAQYLQLQKDLERDMPDLANLAWSHKYLSMLHPYKLDDFHSGDYQRYHLIRLLQLPPAGSGRFACGGLYVTLAAELGLSPHQLCALLNHRHGKPRRYWRVGTMEGETFRFPEMAEGQWVGLGWSQMGALSDISYTRKGKEFLKARLAQHYKAHPSGVGRQAAQWFRFLHHVQEDDIVIAAKGMKVLGIGKVSSGYYFEPTGGFDHRRAVDWLSLERWRASNREGLQTSFSPLRKVETLLAIESKLLDARSGEMEGAKVRSAKAKVEPLPPLTGMLEQIQKALIRKGQVILYGPPGTGKTYWAMLAAQELAARAIHHRPFRDLGETEQASLVNADNGHIRICTFHPGYGYEDFIEGYQPTIANGALVFARRDGLFKVMCKAAEANPKRPYYLIIDEINRGDIPRIFGELITLFEKGKREKTSLTLSSSGERFSVPANIYVIGTMNTADRSIALLDTALRRRFGFLELLPDPSILGDSAPGGVALGPWLRELNKKILQHLGRDARNLQIGHAYLMDGHKSITNLRELSRALQQDLIPLLQEYCYEDYDTLEKLLGTGLVSKDERRILHEKFEAKREDKLVQALLAIAPQISMSPQAIAADESELEADEDMIEEDLDDEQPDGEAQ